MFCSYLFSLLITTVFYSHNLFFQTYACASDLLCFQRKFFSFLNFSSQPPSPRHPCHHVPIFYHGSLLPNGHGRVSSSSQSQWVFLPVQLISIISFITLLNDGWASEKYAERWYYFFSIKK
ncbi:hypothetical protein Lalb_Chr17g0338011 [Lupinus albus]|uniref:Uncharacterized protein n=1 Tax=Lupinus albus TaxID=3870 RepID=A0A6A4NT14_LUPAL|nr:hypothetical protein Lalb_Chr17g0338011 [Lupinus albus]